MGGTFGDRVGTQPKNKRFCLSIIWSVFLVVSTLVMIGFGPCKSRSRILSYQRDMTFLVIGVGSFSRRSPSPQSTPVPYATYIFCCKVVIVYLLLQRTLILFLVFTTFKALQRNIRYCITCDLRQKSVKTTLINQFYLYLFTILFLLAILLPQKCIVLFQNDVKNYCLLIAIVDNNLQLIFYYNKKNVNDKKMLLFYVITFAKQLHVVCMCVGLQKIDRKNYLKQLFSFQFYLHNNNEWDLFIYSFLIKIILFINFQLNQKLYVNKWDIFKQKFQIYQ
eukprot:TRINITY_DN2055_c0_g1_i17.p2 TRINITY_DN2055_c0_g1~~TRINITY_DN2055_c0_g1_i17.p2  ORF type:complete len:278 (-),score=-17.06 TRINITY_DN2055_c0_g1_i17:306-1139(-)